MAIANQYRLHKLSKVDQFVMMYGGLRGAVAFALVLLINPKVCFHSSQWVHNWVNLFLTWHSYFHHEFSWAILWWCLLQKIEYSRKISWKQWCMLIRRLFQKRFHHLIGENLSAFPKNGHSQRNIEQSSKMSAAICFWNIDCICQHTTWSIPAQIDRQIDRYIERSIDR